MNAIQQLSTSAASPSSHAVITLFDLVSAANDVTDSEDEALATVVALLRSGQARFTS